MGDVCNFGILPNAAHEVYRCMKLHRTLLIAALSCATVSSAVAMTHSRRGPTAVSKATTSKSSKKKATKKTAALKGPRAIDDERATQIQNALIKSGYLTGEASGHWDAQSQAAMQKLQSDNGWQTKLIPDSRALIKLGLGPNAAPTAAPTPAATPTASAVLPPSSDTASAVLPIAGR